MCIRGARMISHACAAHYYVPYGVWAIFANAFMCGRPHRLHCIAMSIHLHPCTRMQIHICSYAYLCVHGRSDLYIIWTILTHHSDGRIYIAQFGFGWQSVGVVSLASSESGCRYWRNAWHTRCRAFNLTPARIADSRPRTLNGDLFRYCVWVNRTGRWVANFDDAQGISIIWYTLGLMIQIWCLCLCQYVSQKFEFGLDTIYLLKIQL